MDATRISDGRKVILKLVGRDDVEIEITRYLSQDSFLSDKRNHCVPLLDVLDTGKGAKVFLITPLLRAFDDPRFQSLEDAVEFVNQTIEVRTKPFFYHLFKLLLIEPGLGVGAYFHA